MYAIVDIAGQQLKVEKDQKIFVNRLEGKEGSKIDFDQILLVDDNGKVQVGTPVVKDMVVSATIVSHLKGDKVKVFKKKRRKGYKVLNGHRQLLTELLIGSISPGKAQSVPKTAGKKEEPKTKPDSKADKKPVTAKETKPESTFQTETVKPKSATVKKESKTTTAAKAKSTTAKKETKTGAKPKSTAVKKPQAAKAKMPANKKKDS